jgi:hypothetical protein
VIKVGDCTLENGTLQINADGTAIFWGFASTSDDDDAWVFRGGISLLDVHGTVLWTSGKFVGPSMSGGTYGKRHSTTPRCGSPQALAHRSTGRTADRYPDNHSLGLPIKRQRPVSGGKTAARVARRKLAVHSRAELGRRIELEE